MFPVDSAHHLAHCQSSSYDAFMVYAKVGSWESDLSDQKPLNREAQCIVASLRGIMKSENRRIEPLIKTVNSKHGCQGKEASPTSFSVILLLSLMVFSNFPFW